MKEGYGNCWWKCSNEKPNNENAKLQIPNPKQAANPKSQNGGAGFGIDFGPNGTFTLNALNTYSGSTNLFGASVKVPITGNAGNPSPLGENGTIPFGTGTTGGRPRPAG